MSGLRHKRLRRTSLAATRSSQRANTDPANSQGLGANADLANSQGPAMSGLRHKRLRKPPAPTSGSSQQANTDPVTPQGHGANVDPVTSQVVAASANSLRPDADGVGASTNSQVSTGAGGNCNEGTVSAPAREDPPKKPRARGKRNRTRFRLPPSGGKIELVPMGSKQFTYARYHPKDYKVGSQAGVILKRFYPGLIDVRDEEGNIVGTRQAMSWFDDSCKKDERGVTNARLVKNEFWSVFTVTQQNARKANRNLEAYLAKRVSDIMYQARLDAIKLHEGCNDEEARNILLTEEQYLTVAPDWCPLPAWALLAKHWVSKRFLDRRFVAQEARKKPDREDVAQNKSGSRPWSEAQQYLQYKYGAERAGTLNTYAAMKTGFKNVDNTGRSAPINNRKAKKRLLTCSSGVGSCQDDMQTDSDDGDYHIDDKESCDDIVDDGETSDDMDGEESSDDMDGEESCDEMDGENSSSSEDLDNN